MTAGLPVHPSLVRVSGVRAALSVPVLSLIFALAACGGGDDDTATAAAQTPAPSPEPAPVPAPSPSPSPAPTANHAPTIAGVPLASVTPGTQYSFTPTGADADGDILTFSVSGKPAWAAFTTTSGRLRGTPTAGDVGTTSNIVISVTDGAATVQLAAFSIQVVGTATGSATLSWQPPTENDDGSALTDLAGYKIYWGTSQGNYPNSVTINNPGLTSYVVSELTPATWYFVATALDGQGGESDYSNVATKSVM